MTQILCRFSQEAKSSSYTAMMDCPFVFRYRACDKENPEGRPRLIRLAAQFNFQRFAASREQVEEQHCEQRHIATNLP
jgi:hypothetical protein